MNVECFCQAYKGCSRMWNHKVGFEPKVCVQIMEAKRVRDDTVQTWYALRMSNILSLHMYINITNT